MALNPSFLPPAVIGIVGGGQLGMMTIREAQRMGYRTVVWDPSPDCPASRLANETIVAPFDNRAAAERFSKSVDVITYEFENIQSDTIALLETSKPVRPDSSILRISQHRRSEKDFLRNNGFPTAHFRRADSRNDIQKAIEETGLPAVVKTATSGYDGKGQVVIQNAADVQSALSSLPSTGDGYIVEQFVVLERELSVIVAGSASGQSVTFPVCENEHRENILHATILPARVPDSVVRNANEIARSIADTLNLVGVLCVEMFLSTDGTLLVNELAPRPHNSGHCTLDACNMSQFDAHVRTVCNLPLTQPRLLTPCAMVNLLGKHLQVLDIAEALMIDGAKIHLYGKSKSEPKRKMGHITVTAVTPGEVKKKMEHIQMLIGEKVSAHERQALTQQEKR